jgi:hypothetical protein
MAGLLACQRRQQDAAVAHADNPIVSTTGNATVMQVVQSGSKRSSRRVLGHQSDGAGAVAAGTSLAIGGAPSRQRNRSASHPSSFEAERPADRQ